MEQYKNLGGKSAVVAYEIGNDSITVQFRDGTTRLYNNQSAGAGSVEQMISLAASGQGLNRFIGKVVKKGYA